MWDGATNAGRDPRTETVSSVWGHYSLSDNTAPLVSPRRLKPQFHCYFLLTMFESWTIIDNDLVSQIDIFTRGMVLFQMLQVRLFWWPHLMGSSSGIEKGGRQG